MPENMIVVSECLHGFVLITLVKLNMDCHVFIVNICV